MPRLRAQRNTRHGAQGRLPASGSRTSFRVAALAAIAALALLFSAAHPVVAEATAATVSSGENMGKTAEKFIQGLGDTALTQLTDSTLSDKDRQARFRKLLHSHFDIKTIGRFALGRHWKAATPAQQKEYLSLFEDMVVEVYASRFKEYSGQTFSVTGHLVDDNGKDTVVQSQLIAKEAGAPVLKVDWLVRKKDASYRIIDIVVEGVSMSITQRSDFSAVIQSGGGNIESLLKSLRERKASKAL